MADLALRRNATQTVFPPVPPEAVERDCAESQSQQYRWLALTPNQLRLVLRTQLRS